MGFDGVDAEIEEVGDFFVGFAFGDELEDFAFAGGEEVVRIFAACAFQFLDVVVEEDAADGRAEEGFTFGDAVDGADEIGFGGIFEQVAAGAGFEGAEDVGFVGIHAEDDDRSFRIAVGNLFGGFDAVEVGHADVEYGDVGFELGGLRDGLTAVFGFADDGEFGLLFDEQTEAATDEGVVVGEQDANFFWIWAHD